MATPPPASAAVRENIEAVRKLEEAFVANRTVRDRIADGIGAFTGSFFCVVLHLLLIVSWIVWNSEATVKFDPFPFPFLGVVVSSEALFLSTFVLMKQNRMSKREDLRAHLGLQINLLSEREMTLVLQLLQQISTRLGVRLSPGELEELTEQTSVEDLASQLRESLPEE